MSIKLFWFYNFVSCIARKTEKHKTKSQPNKNLYTHTKKPNKQSEWENTSFYLPKLWKSDASSSEIRFYFPVWKLVELPKLNFQWNFHLVPHRTVVNSLLPTTVNLLSPCNDYACPFSCPISVFRYLLFPSHHNSPSPESFYHVFDSLWWFLQDILNHF